LPSIEQTNLGEVHCTKELARSTMVLERVHSTMELELVHSTMVLELARKQVLEQHNFRLWRAIWREDHRRRSHLSHEASLANHRRNRLVLQLRIQDLRLPMRWQASSTYYDSSRYS